MGNPDSKPSEDANLSPVPPLGKPKRKALPLRQSLAARLTLVFGIIAWAVLLYSHLTRRHTEPAIIPALILIPSLAITFLCSLFILFQRFLSLFSQKDYPLFWPTLPALLLLLFFFLMPLIPYIPVYFKSGGSVSLFLFNWLDRTDYELKRAMEITEALRLKEGTYLPWCPMSQRVHPPFDVRQLPPELASLPTFSMTEADIKQNDFTVHPGLRDNYFARKWRLPLSYFKTDARNDSTTISGYIIWTCGPDEHYDLTGDNIGRVYSPVMREPSALLIQLTYDPSNGARSSGDIYRAKFFIGKR